MQSNNYYCVEDSIYLKNNPDWHISDSPWKATQILKMLKRNQFEINSIAEAGCGAGEILNQLYQRHPNKDIKFYGYEIAPDAFQLCLKRSNDRLDFFTDDIFNVNKKFGLLLIMDVIEHVDDYIGFIKQCSDKADYKLYHIPLDFSVLGLLRNVPMTARQKVNHIHYFTKDIALSAISDTGQRIIDYFYTPVMVEVHNKGVYTKVLNIFRRLLFKISPDFCVNLLGGYSIMVLAK